MISLDPNVRPQLDPRPGGTYAGFAEWVPLVDVLKVSTEDLAWMYPDRSAEEVAADWRAAGVTAGVLAYLHERRLLSRDALRTLDAPALEELLQTACTVAADTCTRTHRLGAAGTP